MKSQMLGGAAPDQAQLPAADSPTTAPTDKAVDDELEALKSQLDQL